MYNGPTMPQSKLYILPGAGNEQSTPSNLPSPIARLVGRESDLDALSALLLSPDTRLVTLTGPGGVGKTRLALQLAAGMLDAYPDGVYFVDLSSITDPALVIPTITAALTLNAPPGATLYVALSSFLQNRKILLVLDNFEQVISAALPVAGLLASCSGLNVIITSRALLRIQAEREYAVSPLATPASSRPLSVAQASRYSAVSLFVQRAHSVDPSFELTDTNAEAIVDICIKIDGLPLAIELVTAHARLLTPQDMLARLSNPLRLLSGKAPETTARHRTIRSTIEWSYRLLSRDEQKLFRRLSVFVGGFTLRAAEAVCNDAGDVDLSEHSSEAIDILESLGTLLDSSLIKQPGQDAEEKRFAMLQTVREFASEQLIASGEFDLLHQRHAAYHLQLARSLNTDPAGKEGVNNLNRLAPDHENFRAALSFLARSAPDDALQLLESAQSLWERFMRSSEVISWIEQVLARVGPEPSKLRIWACRFGAIQAQRIEEFDVSAGWIANALAMARALNDKREILECINLQSRVALGTGDYPTARTLMEEVLAVCREIGNRFMEAATLINLVGVAQSRGEYARAELLSRQGLAIFTEIENNIGIMWAHLNLGDTLHRLNRLAEAREYLMKALTIAQQADHPLAIETLVVLGNVAIDMIKQSRSPAVPNMRIQQAVSLYGLASLTLERRGTALDSALQPLYERNLAYARQQLGDDLFNTAWQEGRAAPISRAVELADRIPQPVSSAFSKKRIVSGLTSREANVAALVARGMTNPEIAARLVLSVRTVEAHVANVMQKLNLHNRTEVAAWAIRERLPLD